MAQPDPALVIRKPILLARNDTGQVVQLSEGTLITEGVGGSIIMAVRYPYRRSNDAYLVLEGSVRCLQCDADIEREQEAVVSHVRSHDRRKRVKALV